MYYSHMIQANKNPIASNMMTHYYNFSIVTHYIGGTGAKSSEISKILLDIAPVPPI